MKMRRVLAFVLSAMIVGISLAACQPAIDEGVSSSQGTQSENKDSSQVQSNLNTMEASSAVESVSSGGQSSAASSTSSKNNLSSSASSTSSGGSEEDYGVKIMDFSIEQPTAKTTVSAAQFGMSTSSRDNTRAFSTALAYMAANPGTVLSIPKGKYKFDPGGRMSMSRIENGIIEGNGSEFIFAEGEYFDIIGCDTLKVQNLTIDWDWDIGGRLASLVKVRNVSGNTVTFEFLEVEDASFAVNSPWETFNQFDSKSLTPGCAGGKEFWNLSSSVSNKKHLGGNIVSVTFSQAGSMESGDVYLLRHYTYHSSVFYIAGENTQNITLKDIKIYSALGSGVVAGSGAHHMLFSGVTIGLRPGTEDKYRISTTVDAFHIADTQGYFIMENCDVSFQGDDCLNVHDNLGTLSSIDGKTITVSCFNGRGNFNAGAKIRFRDTSQYQAYDIEATVVSKTTGSNRVILTLDKDISGVVPVGAVVSDLTRESGNYIVRNCYFHENRARGLLLGSSNGLVENNRFYKTQGAAILIPIDVGSSWMEGTGVNNLVIRNNTFDTCNVNNWTPMLNFTTNINGMSLRGKCFTNIAILNNTISNIPSEAINIDCADNVTVVGNVIKNTVAMAGGDRGRISAGNFGKLTVKDNTWYRSEYMEDDVNEIFLTDRNPDLSKAVFENNILK